MLGSAVLVFSLVGSSLAIKATFTGCDYSRLEAINSYFVQNWPRQILGEPDLDPPLNISHVKIDAVDAIGVPSTLRLGFCLSVRADLHHKGEPFNVVLELKRSMPMVGFVKVPCVGTVGSCVYEDLCKLQPYANAARCPVEFGKMPCKCPDELPTGEFFCFHGVPLEIPPSPYPVSGHYKAVAEMYMGDIADNKLAACAQVEFQLSQPSDHGEL